MHTKLLLKLELSEKKGSPSTRISLQPTLAVQPPCREAKMTCAPVQRLPRSCVWNDAAYELLLLLLGVSAWPGLYLHWAAPVPKVNFFRRNLPGGKSGQNESPEGPGCVMAEMKTQVPPACGGSFHLTGLSSLQCCPPVSSLYTMAPAQPSACSWRREKRTSPSAAIASQHPNEQAGGWTHQSCDCSLSARGRCGPAEPKAGSGMALGTFPAQRENRLFPRRLAAYGRQFKEQRHLHCSETWGLLQPRCRVRGRDQPCSVRPQRTLHHLDKESQTSPSEVMRNSSACTKNTEKAGEK